MVVGKSHGVGQRPSGRPQLVEEPRRVSDAGYGKRAPRRRAEEAVAIS